jgi:hypothetical protein
MDGIWAALGYEPVSFKRSCGHVGATAPCNSADTLIGASLSNRRVVLIPDAAQLDAYNDTGYLERMM